jgi:acetolactate synthase-1/2/3 large subunit
MIIRPTRPVIIAGHGIRLAKAEKEFRGLLTKLKIPILSTFNGFDLIESDNKYYIGRIGTVGQRAGNFALQNADLIISIGSRNNIRQISYNWDNFGRAAKKIFVDIDNAELLKPTIKPDLAINSDAKLFINTMLIKLNNKNIPNYTEWLNWCIERKEKFSVVLPEYKKIKKLVQPYYFIDVLTNKMKPTDVAVAGNGTACVTLFQAGIVKKGQRIFWNSGCASMGYDLPAAIGACIGSGQKNTVCIAGDGSLQMNIQELQTVKHHNLPVKLFYLDNGGYISIQQTQDNFFAGNRVACDKSCGVSFPDIINVARAYGIKSVMIDNQAGMAEKIEDILKSKEPVICEVKLVRDYTFSPKLSSEKKPDGRMVSKPLEDMYPFLSREEFKTNMIVPIINEE